MTTGYRVSLSSFQKTYKRLLPGIRERNRYPRALLRVKLSYGRKRDRSKGGKRRMDSGKDPSYEGEPNRANEGERMNG